MSLPKEPRQKMINMMYLVLTALLALNVSSEILNAFKTVNNSLVKSIDVVNQSTGTYISSLQQKLNEPEARVKAQQWYPLAQKAQGYTAGLYNYIESLKDSLMRGSGYDPSKGDTTFREDNLDASTRIIVEGTSGSTLFEKLKQYQKDMLAIDPLIAKEFSANLPIDLSMPKSDNKGNNTWEAAYFRMTPTIAALTILSKFQNDVKTTENKIIAFCHNQVGKVEVRFDAFSPIVGANSTYFMPGDQIEVSAGLGAFNSQKPPRITINGASATVGSDGMARQKFAVSGVGSHSVSVNIQYVDQDGNIKSIPKTIEYTVGSPTGASVSADAVKVLYIGLDNPLTITGGTSGAEKTQATISNGSLQNLGGGKFVANVTTPGKATINVVVDGKSTPFDFRVKNVPNPIAMIGQNENTRVAANVIKSQAGVRADLRDFVFEGVKFDIIGYTVYATGAGFTEQPGIAQNPGAYFNADSKRILDKLRPGSTLVIDEIKAVGPGGGTRKLQALVFNLY